MALIPLYHVIADEVPVSSAASIMMGSFVKLSGTATAPVIIQATGVASEIAYGVAGDTKNTSTPGIPSTNPAHIGVDGTEVKFTNRVSDPYDETRASGKITVYHSGGKFATDQYDTTLTYAPGEPLYVGAAGKLQNVNAGSGQIVGRVVSEGAYMSGVPGIDINGDISLGDYLIFKLVI